jgi:DNA (cytosine-5)-methyltransferase 1
MALAPIRVLSVCAGGGALDVAIELATNGRARTVGFCERDSFAAAVLVARMENKALPSAPIWDDLTSFDGRRWRGAVDLVVAGFPCPPVSQAGKRLGTADERWLWPEIAHIIEDVQPAAVFLENVSGLLSASGGEPTKQTRDTGRDCYACGQPMAVASTGVGGAMGDVLGELARLGFHAEWSRLSAAEIGATHPRARVFIFAWRQEMAHPDSTGLREFWTLNDQYWGHASGDHVNGCGERLLGDAADKDGRAREFGEEEGTWEEAIGRERPAGPGSRIRNVADAGGVSGEHAGEPSDVVSPGGEVAGEGDQRERGWDAAGDCRATLGYTDRPRWPEAGSRHPLDAGSQFEQGGQAMAHSVGERLEGLEQAGPASGAAVRGWPPVGNGLPLFPPGRTDSVKWERIVTAHPDLAPVTESKVHGVADGSTGNVDVCVCSRTEQLRVLGNAVVPLQAAAAFRLLVRRAVEA